MPIVALSISGPEVVPAGSSTRHAARGWEPRKAAFRQPSSLTAGCWESTSSPSPCCPGLDQRAANIGLPAAVLVYSDSFPRHAGAALRVRQWRPLIPSDFDSHIRPYRRPGVTVDRAPATPYVRRSLRTRDARNVAGSVADTHAQMPAGERSRFMRDLRKRAKPNVYALHRRAAWNALLPACGDAPLRPGPAGGLPRLDHVRLQAATVGNLDAVLPCPRPDDAGGGSCPGVLALA